MADETDKRENEAPGAPGNPPTWTSSAKDMVSTALGSSRIWATFGYGIVNEVYWPSTGEPQVRDLGFIVKGPKGWTEVKRAQRYLMTMPKGRVPLPRMIHEGDGYRLELEFLTHPLRDTLLVRYALDGDDVTLYALLAPHMGGDRTDNQAWAGDDLTARKGGVSLCLRAAGGFSRTSAGYVGTSDGWQDFEQHGEMRWTYGQASNGNVALTGELSARSGTLALSFAENLAGARTLARSSLADDYDATRDMFVGRWAEWGKLLQFPYTTPELLHQAEVSATVLKIHDDRTYGGAMVASLSVPWGQSHDDLGGYHLVWTRDMVEAALAMVVTGQLGDAARVLAYLIGTQAEDGGWAQNYFPDGRGYWTGNQLDEVALPILLAAKLKSVGSLVIGKPVEDMIHRAVGYVVRNGPMTDQDRWEENSGASPFTLALTVSALVGAAPFFDAEESAYLLALADCWNERIEDWTYVRGGGYCADHGIDGYYVRIGPGVTAGGLTGTVAIRNTHEEPVAADTLVGLEFLYLVRTGLRAADDPRIVATVKLVDELLRVDTPAGPSYRRYNGDGYGEHDDGSPFDGTGIGRLWPLLTGERGHYAMAAGEDVRPYLDAMVRMAGKGGLLPEQIWDREAIPERGLYPGKPSGSAMPLVWAHAEFLKLLAGQTTGRAAELLDAVESRWGGKAPAAATWFWRANSRFRRVPGGRRLVFEDGAGFMLNYALDGGPQKSAASAPSHFGLNAVAIAADDLAGARQIAVTLSFADGKSLSETIDIDP
jgi:glucoamylase